jgi:hypothetical protein
MRIVGSKANIGNRKIGNKWQFTELKQRLEDTGHYA